MAALTPQVVYDLETRMQAIVENEYLDITSNLWFPKIVKVRPSESRREIISWLLNTGTIEDAGTKGGTMSFEDMVAVYTEYEARFQKGKGLKLTRAQLTDNDGQGFQFAADWSGMQGSLFAYHPQKLAAKAILNGETGLAYDGQPFFAGWDGAAHTGLHPYNPFNTSLGGYANIFTGNSDSGAGYDYPGACPIDDTVSVEQAFINLSKVLAYIASIKLPNGEDPRFLRPMGLIGPPRMSARMQQLTGAKFIAQAATSGGGSGDIEAVIKNWGQSTPIEAPELAANMSYKLPDGTTVTGSNDTCYLYCEQLSQRQLGGLVYVDREPFKITYYTGQGGGTGIDAILDRADELEWHSSGRNVMGYGHPFVVFKLKRT